MSTQRPRYLPSLPPQRNETPPSTTHLHLLNETLTEHEDGQNFQIYLNGRTSAYKHTTANIHDWISKAEETQRRYQHDAAMRALIDGQIEGLKEILQLVQNSQTRNGPTE